MNFELTSASTFYLLLSFSLISFFTITLFWQKIFRKGIGNFILRSFLLLIIQFLILVSVGVGINQSQGFYSSWTDLFGGTQDFTSKAVAADSLKVFSPLDFQKAQTTVGSLKIFKEVITGTESQVSNLVYLVVPESAAKTLESGEQLDPSKYLVTEFVTGFPSKPEMWFKALSVDKDIATFNSNHTKEIIGVIPEINVAGQFDLECMNLPNGEPAAETWLTDDMKSYVDTRLGFKSQRWIAAGVSTGGWCSYMFAIKHPDKYAGALSIAGYFRSALPLKDPLALQKAMIKKYNVSKMEAALTSKTPLYVVASLGDTYSIRETTRFLAKKHRNLLIKYHEIATGGHNPRVWKSAIKPGLEWLEGKVKP
jgi:hypothetical protein